MSKILSSKEIGDRLRKFRLQAGWSQERLSELIGVSPQQFQKYETGKNMMNTEKLQLAAKSLSIPIQALFTESDDNVPVGVSEQLLLDSYRTIPSEKLKESILEIVLKVSSK